MLIYNRHFIKILNENLSVFVILGVLIIIIDVKKVYPEMNLYDDENQAISLIFERSEICCPNCQYKRWVIILQVNFIIVANYWKVFHCFDCL